MYNLIVKFLLNTVLSPIKNAFAKNTVAFILGIIIIISGILGSTIISNIRMERDTYKANYAAATIKTIIWKNAYGDKVAKTYQEILTHKEVINSKDGDIRDLKNKAKQLNIKVRRLEYMLCIKADTILDTITVPTITRINDTVYKEIDSLVIGKLTINRIKISNSNIAKWKVGYFPILSGFIAWEKEGKWRLINIIKPRQKLYFAEIVSDDKLINIKNVKLVKVR